ncbi:MAG: hypothetical protein IJL70_06120 [Treponema sp.]|nr:hypothetical protein [Treponema sp.]
MERKIFLPVLLVLCIFVFSCSKSASRMSFTSSLDQIDALINQNQYADAEKELGKLEKFAYGSWAEIGIFRRYCQIGCNQKAEKVLLNGLKKNPENLELNAVYTHFLMRNKKLDEALAAGRCLQGTKYGSLYSEAVLKDTLKKADSSALAKIFHSDDYFPVYYDAYKGTGDNAWLRNCALLRLYRGEYTSACAVHPDQVFGVDDAYFWALVMYDGSCFADSIQYSETALKMLDSGNAGRFKKTSKKSLVALTADSYISLSDAERAETVRSSYLDSISDYRTGWILPEGYENDTELPVIFVNSAKWSRDNLEEDRCVALLSLCVESWPDYVPALTAYADFALSSNKALPEDNVVRELRDAGLATLEMEKYDNRARIPVSDAIYKIDESLKREKNPLLYIVRLDIRYKIETKLSDKEKTADIWRILEENMVRPSVFDELLLSYAENYFLSSKDYENAWTLFYKYISKKYDISADSAFWENMIRSIHSFTLKENELAAYFASMALRSEDAVCLYENAVYENGLAGTEGNVSALASDKACLNLAMIYNSLGKKAAALDLYSKTTGRCSDMYLKSMAMYRMALIYYADKDYRNARRCAEYSVSLNRRNSEAIYLLAILKQL